MSYQEFNTVRRNNKRFGAFPLGLGQPLLLLLLLSLSADLVAQDGLLDPSFKIGTGTDAPVNTLVILPDQRILVGGEFTVINGHSNSYLARLNFDGTVDDAFNPAGQTDGYVFAMFQQPDGKILIGGDFDTFLGTPRRGLARLQEDGTLDPSFDPGILSGGNGGATALAPQEDGRILVGCCNQEGYAQLNRLHTDGTSDSTFAFTNRVFGFVLGLVSLPDGSALVGLNLADNNSCLLHVLDDGRLDEKFDAGLTNSGVICLATKPNGQILVGGRLQSTNATRYVPLLQLNADLRWDDTFQPDDFQGGLVGVTDAVSSVLVQPDGSILVGGHFFNVGGYWRRQIARLSPAGRVDGCFDPGLGLGGSYEAGPVRRLALHTNGCVLVGGRFDGAAGKSQPNNLARLLPQSGPCSSIRVYIGDPGGDHQYGPLFAAATFPPGGINVLEWSTNLVDWQESWRTADPYIYWRSGTLDPSGKQFFRARQER